MLTIAIVSQKGGAGKSTLSAHLTAYAASNGVKCALIDLDPQASVSAWHGLREADDIELIPSHPPLVAKQVDQLTKTGFELCIIDTPPHNSTAAANAINSATLTVVPVRPSAFDLAGAQATFDLIKQNKAKGGAVLMAVPSGSSVEQAATEFITGSGLKVIGRTGQRIAFQHAINEGKGVTEYARSSVASEEIIKLWESIRSIKV